MREISVYRRHWHGGHVNVEYSAGVLCVDV